MKMEDDEIDYLEECIPALAQLAVTQAYWQTLASGLSLVTLIEGAIYEVFPDGARKKIKDAEPSYPIALGAKRQIR